MRTSDRILLISSTFITVIGIFVGLATIVTTLTPAPTDNPVPAETTLKNQPDASTAGPQETVKPTTNAVLIGPVQPDSTAQASTTNQESVSHHAVGPRVVYEEEYVDEGDETVDCECVCPSADDQDVEDDSEPEEPPPSA